MVRCIHFPFIVLLITWRKQGILGSDVNLNVEGTICVGNNITLGCTIDPFTTIPSATWSRNGPTALTTCTSGSFCTLDDLTINSVTYYFSGNTTGIFVSFQLQAQENGIEWICNHNATPYRYKFEVPSTCNVSKTVEDVTHQVVKNTAKANAPVPPVIGSGSGGIQIYSRVKFTSTVAEKWRFSNRYILCGTVVYGIQIVLVSSVINTVTIAIGVGVLVYYYGQIKCIAILYVFLLAAAFSIVGVSIYMLILIFFGNKDCIQIKFKKKKESIKLSAHGMKPIMNNNICIYFKVKAIYASITLHIIENMEERHVGSKPNTLHLKKVLPLCFIDDSNDSNNVNIGNDTHTKYQAFYLKCENKTKTKTITVLDGNDKQIEQWTVSADSFKIGDIEISNKKQDDSTKNDSANYDSTKDDSKIDNSTEYEQEELDTTDEWIFWFREGDTLGEIEENSQFHQTVLLICVVILPIAWLVMIVLILRYLLKSKEKNTDNTESELGVKLNQNQKEPSEQQIKDKNDTEGKWFDFTSCSCCHNSVKPNSTKDNKPKAMPGSYLANSPKGRNLPKLPEIVTQGDEIRKTKKKDKKKKKIKNQDSNMNDKQQSHCDKQNITFQPEIAVAADTLEAE